MSVREFSYRPNGNPQFLQDNLQKFGTAVATEEQVGPSIRIPSGMIGKNGSFSVILRALATNDAVVKNLRVRIGNTPDVLTGTEVLNAVLTSLAGGTARLSFANRNDSAINLTTAEGPGLSGIPVARTIDCTKDLYLVFSTQKASGAAASISLESYKVDLQAEPVASSFQ